ncbi:hypothetical protein [Pararhodonellum marinum]|uniref:hypothetical protein n=1 Tax=Pararhodonellum marinum TaxID=2755358 RepID=UPI0018904E54|nr:hypothetical protein [Pararhodonellum marinum]
MTKLIFDCTGGVIQYNGNISAMTWSKGFGHYGGQKGYKYNYDFLNRITAANFQEFDAGWSNNNLRHNTTYGYDKNGNFSFLKRRDEDRTFVDNLSYDYGTNASRGNLLNKLSDSGNKNKGFIDATVSGNSYGYDVNGNLLLDKHKGIDSIRYNYMNLPEKVKF